MRIPLLPTFSVKWRILTYELTAIAKEDLRHIALYITEQAGDKNIATRFVHDLQKNVKFLSISPSAALFRKTITMSQDHRFNRWLAPPLKGVITGLAPKRGTELY